MIGDKAIVKMSEEKAIPIFFSGTQLFCLGILGQYLAQIHAEAKKRPHYIIAEQKIRGD